MTEDVAPLTSACLVGLSAVVGCAAEEALVSVAGEDCNYLDSRKVNCYIFAALSFTIWTLCAIGSRGDIGVAFKRAVGANRPRLLKRPTNKPLHITCTEAKSDTICKKLQDN
jgi:hypothetical protein